MTRFVDRGAIVAAYVGIGMAMVIAVSFLLVIPIEPAYWLLAPLSGLLIGYYADARADRRSGPWRRILGNGLFAGLVTGVTLALLLLGVKALFFAADNGFRDPGLGGPLSCSGGASCVFARYEAQDAAGLASAGITDVSTFTSFYWGQQLQTAGTLIVVTLAGSAGGAIAFGLTRASKRSRVATPSLVATSDGYRAELDGQLPIDGGSPIEDLPLPAGHLVYADGTIDDGSTPIAATPVLWSSDDVIADIGRLWTLAAARFPKTGLWPIILEAEDGGSAIGLGHLEPSAATDPGAFDARAVLAGYWPGALPVDDEADPIPAEMAPFGREFPGLAPRIDRPTDKEAPAATARGLTGRLGLVPARRPADAIRTLGWTGPVNQIDDTGSLSAVLRSWEDRFGAIVVGLGQATMVLAVGRRPTTQAEATAVAAEHLAVCPDIIWQGTYTVQAYVDLIKDQRVWSFWWD